MYVCMCVSQAYEVYETNLEYNLRFMVDNNVVGCNWIELPAGKYKMRTGSAKLSQCQVFIFPQQRVVLVEKVSLSVVQSIHYACCPALHVA